MQERIWRSDKRSYIRLLPKALNISTRGCSRLLERAMSDFGFEHSYQSAVERLREHYGFVLSSTVLARVTQGHANAIAKKLESRSSASALPAKGAEQIVAQSDGTFLRIVSTDSQSSDRRKSRRIDFKEARLCAATKHKTDRVFYEATFETVDEVGLKWAQATKQAGRGLNSHIHVVSDGATWIASQAKQLFGEHGTFLVDFFHLCEYLAAASETCSSRPKQWLQTQKKRLKKGHYKKVIKELSQHCEAQEVPDEKAPVRCAHRYMLNRRDQFDYSEAIEKELPIGSGLIESGHKHVLQARMKIPGASWSMQNAETMVQARTFRANGYWNQYWLDAA